MNQRGQVRIISTRIWRGGDMKGFILSERKLGMGVALLAYLLQCPRIMCCIPGTWDDSLTVNITVEEFCQQRKKEKSCP